MLIVKSISAQGVYFKRNSLHPTGRVQIRHTVLVTCERYYPMNALPYRPFPEPPSRSSPCRPSHPT